MSKFIEFEVCPSLAIFLFLQISFYKSPDFRLFPFKISSSFQSGNGKL